MLEKLGFKHFAYDWRGEHLPTLETELDELKRRNIELTAVWFPGLDDDGRRILDLLGKRGLHTQLWVTGGGGPTPSGAERRERIEAEANRIRPIAEAAAKLGCQVGLYNHGGWFGEPENQLAVLDRLGMKNVGLVYNLHHGHDHLDRLPELMRKMLPHLLAVNLNGMFRDGEQTGRKIVPLGQGPLDLEVLRTIRASGYRGPIGILGHTQDDAQDRLQDNLDGLDWLVPQLDGKPAGPTPVPRTAAPQQKAAAPGGNAAPSMAYLAEGRAEYRTPPLAVELRATLHSQNNYNILVASDTKQSGSHWELFSLAGSGLLTAYLPSSEPDHVRTTTNICDNRPHDIVMLYERERVRLYVDGKLAADQAIRSKNTPPVPGSLAIGQLVEGGLGCDGQLDFIRIARGATEPPAALAAKAFPPLAADPLGYWRFDRPAADRADDLSKFKNHARRATAGQAVGGQASANVPPPGVHLQPLGAGLKVVLVDRSAADAYMGVRVDSAGQVFVGGREAVFVFVPDGRGGYHPRRQLLKLPPDSIAIGLEFRGNDLYVLANSALSRLPDGRVQHVDLKPQRILWGLPLDLHVSFHCLAWGPQGDLYLNHGDPLLNYGDWSRPDHWGHWSLFAGPEQTRVPYTGQGCVLRVGPDGSRPRIVAGGLRGPVGLAFDPSWNLLTNDNDHESRAELYAPSRLLHVTPHIDFGWPRGWMASKSPERADLVEPVCSDLGRGVPCDLTFYDEPYLADALGGKMLMCRWDAHAVTGYKLHANGATLSAAEETLLKGDHDARPVGVAVGQDGRLFVTALYMAGNAASPYCASDLYMVTRDDDADDRPFDAYDVTQASADHLAGDLLGQSWQRRGRAHQELLRRRGEDLAKAVNRLESQPAAAASIHLPWLLAADNSQRGVSRLTELARSEHAHLRRQALAALAESPIGAAACAAAIGDADPQVQLIALGALIDGSGEFPLDGVLRLACSDDLYLRQTACKALAARATLSQLETHSSSSDAAVRLAAVLALALQLTVPAPNDEPPHDLPLFIPGENSFFKTRLAFVGGAQPVELASLGRIGSYTTAERWAKTPHHPDDERRAKLLARALTDPAERVQLQAAYSLGLLRDPQCEPLIERTRREIAVRRFDGAAQQPVDRIWLLGPLSAQVELKPKPEDQAIDLSTRYETSEGPRSWQILAADSGALAIGRPEIADYYGCFAVQSGSRQRALITTTWPGALSLWQNGNAVPGHVHAETKSMRFLVDLQPGGNDLLIKLSSPTSKSGNRLAVRLCTLAAATIALPEKLDSAELAKRLSDAAGNPAGQNIPPELLAVDWPAAVRQGNTDTGRRLFGTLGCVKCHAVAADQQGGGGPSLHQAAKRLTIPYLVESILLPSKQVAEPFRATRVVTADGLVLTGLVTAESASEIELLLADTSRRKIAVVEIDERSVSELSPMPQGLVKTPQELADLLAYLLSDRPLPP